MLENLYLTKLWRTSKVLFFGIMIFVSGQAFFTYKGILNFPFFPFEMYSFPVTENDENSIVEIYVNDTLFNYTSLPNWTEGNIINTILFNQKFQEGDIWASRIWHARFGKPDTEFKKLIYHRLVPTQEQMNTYPEWLMNYLEANIHTSIYTLNIRQNFYQNENQRLVFTGKETILLDYRR